MKINIYDFSGRFWGGIFSQFSKKYYNDAIVMQRWVEAKVTERKADCYETPMYHAGEGYISYILNIPKPLPLVCTGTIILRRMSKNRYRAAMDNGTAVRIETFATLKELELYCEKFFA